jgi:hypothetical protein
LELINLIFRLGVLFAIYGFLWFFIELLLQVLIGGRQRAKVARDEVKFDPEAVRRLGGGDLQRGAQKLYALMEKAQKARKAAGRGQDTKLRKALSK